MSHGALWILGSVFVLVALAEAIWPRFESPYDVKGNRARKVHNLILGFLYRVVGAALLFGPAFVASTKLQWWHRGALGMGVLGFTFDLLLYDFLNYFSHWLGHKVPALWRLHSVHHLDNHLDVTTGLRVHPVEKLC